MNEWLKLPGLFYRSEFEQVIEVDGEHEYVFQRAGHDNQGRELVAIYCRVRHSGGAALIDIPRAKHVVVARAANEGGVA